MLLVLLSKTREDTETSIDEIASLCRIPKELLRTQIEMLAEKDLLSFDDVGGRISACQRLALAVEAIQRGSDIEKVSRFLTWQEFEQMSRESLECAGFSTKRHVVFKWGQKRSEIDLLGMKEPIIISADCKHWRRNQPSTLEKAAANQLARTMNFLSILLRDPDAFGVGNWKDVRLLPIVVAMSNREIPFSYGVPIVPILKLHSFLMEIDPFVPGIRILQANPEVDRIRNATPTRPKPRQTKLTRTSSISETNVAGEPSACGAKKRP
ncbi:MAG: hypothetical protein V1857_03890 [archaeon]